MQLVKEGKLSPEDAAELIEAFNDAPDGGEKPQEEQSANEEGEGQGDDKFEGALGALIGSIEKIGSDVSEKVDWKDIAGQVREGVSKGVEAIKNVADEAGIKEGFGSFLGHQEMRKVELPLDVPEDKILRIESTSGNLQIIGGAELGSLEASAAFRAYNREEAAKKALNYSPVIEEGDDFVRVSLNEGPDSTVDAIIHVSHDVHLEVKHAAGDTLIRETGGSLRFDGASGNVSLSGLNGTIDVTLSSGDLKLELSEATLATIETKSGDILLDKVTGSVNVRSSSGDVSLQEVSGRTISVEAASGDISVDANEPIDGSLAVRTVSGDVKVEITDGCDARVSMSTVSGSASTSVELDDLQEEESKVTGRLGEGNGTIDISAINGSVTLGWRDSTVE
jgi:hypothetical protein